MRALALGCIAALLAAAGAAQARPAREWLPLAIGREWHYTAHWDRMHELPGAPVVRSFGRGWSREHVVGTEPATGDAPIFRVQVDTSEQALDGSGERRDRHERLLASTADGAFLFPVAAEGDARTARRLDPPVRLLPAAPRPGQRWAAGTLRLDELEVELAGEVVGLEDVEVNRVLHPDCLHVRLAGTPRGFARSDLGRSRVSDGRFEIEAWFAAGVGLVKEVTRTELTLESREGRALSTSSVVTRRLQRAEPPPDGG